MPFNGSGTFVPLAAPDFPAVAGNLIEASKFNANLLDVFNEGLSKCIAKDGQSTVTGNLPMAGFRHTGAGDPVSNSDYATWGKVAGLRGSIGTADWDTFTVTGMYEAVAASLTGASSNYPPTSNIGQLFVINQGSVIIQTYLHKEGTASRAKVSGTWGSWRTLEAISANLTMSVPSVYATVQDALSYLAGKVILSNVTVTISVASGTVTTSTEITVNHPNGERIQIIGAGKTSTFLLRDTVGTVLKVATGTKLGLIKDLTLRGSTVTTSIGLHIDGSIVNEINGISADIVDYPLYIDNGGRLNAVNGVCTFNYASAAVCVVMDKGSFAIFNTASQVLRDIFVDGGSFLYLSTNITSGTAGIRLLVQNGSRVQIGANVTCSGASFSGVKLINKGSIVVNSGWTLTSSSNGTYGYEYDNAERPAGTFLGSGNTTALESPGLSLGDSNDDTRIGGSDDILLSPGTSKHVKFGTHSAIAAETVTGYITIKDAGGTLRKLAVVS